MTEVYAFFAAFPAQILGMSVLFPVWLVRRAREQAASIPAERLAQLYPGVDFGHAQERFLTRYRALNMGIAVLGVLLLSWLFIYMRRPTWDYGDVIALQCGYSMLQMLPMFIHFRFAVRFFKVLRHALPEGKRKAVLQRRGLFDFVSPFTVFVAVLSYFLFIAFMIYLQQHSYSEFDDAPLLIGIITLGYALNAFHGYRGLYGKKINPLETHADRVHTIGLTVKAGLYTCIASVVFVSLQITLGLLLDLGRWMPFALSVFIVIMALICSITLTAPPRRPEADGLDPSPAS